MTDDADPGADTTGTRARPARVEVVNYPDGRFAVQFEGTTLGFTLFDKIQTVQSGAIEPPRGYGRDCTDAKGSAGGTHVHSVCL